MPWLPEMVDEVQVVDGEGRPRWICHTGAHRVKAHNPGPCPCNPTPCEHLGEKLGTVPCGCGSIDRTLPVYSCEVLVQCTEHSTGKPQRFKGAKLAVCLGCPKYAAQT